MSNQHDAMNPMRRRLLQASGGLVMSGLLPACGGGSDSDAAVAPSTPTPTPTGPSYPADITLSAMANAVILDMSFAGLSVEKQNLSYNSLSGGNTALIGVFKQLGPGVLRIGGNSADKSSWQATGPDQTAYVITRAGVDRLAQFVQACNWKVIYGMNFVTNTPASMADEASYAAGALGNALIGFELCNEPDLYNRNIAASAVSTYATFKTQWEQYAIAIRVAVPSSVLTGPASSYNYKNYTIPFASDEKNLISLLTQHYYRNPATATIPSMLAPDPNLVTMLQALQGAASPTLPYRMAETNTYYSTPTTGSGVAGISDAHASALWAINYLFTLAQYGCQGANFHTGGTATYSPIKFQMQSGTVMAIDPEYYGVYLFRQAAQGTLLQTTLSTQGTTLFAYSVQATDGSTVVVLVNIDSSATYQARIACAPTASGAQLTTLSGPSLDSLTGTQINGATFATDGSWSPQPPVAATITNGQLAIAIAPASAVLARIS